MTEVFTGDIGCDDARYLLLELGEPYLEGVNDYLMLTLGGENHANTTYLDVTEMLPRDAGAGTKFLIGTASVETAFGITPDIVVESFPLEPHAGYVGVCFNELGYHAADGQHMCAGGALRRMGDTWINSPPKPENFRGQVADVLGCGTDDSSGTGERLDGGSPRLEFPDAEAGAATDEATLPWDAGAGRCLPSVFEPPPPETSASTDERSAESRPPQSMSSSDAGRDHSTDGTSSTSPRSSDVSADSANPVGSTSNITELVDAGSVSTPAATSDGCSCRVGRSASSRVPASALALLAAALGLVRRRGFSRRGDVLRRNRTTGAKG